MGIASNIKNKSLELNIETLLSKGVVCYCRPVAKEKAKKIRAKGVLCKSINKFTIKILK